MCGAKTRMVRGVRNEVGGEGSDASQKFLRPLPSFLLALRAPAVSRTASPAPAFVKMDFAAPEFAKSREFFLNEG